MLDWWFDLSPLLRAGVALLILGASAAVLFLTGRIFFWGWGAGIVLLLASFLSDSEKKGYRF